MGNKGLLLGDFLEDFEKSFEGGSRALGAVWGLLVVTVEISSSGLAYILTEISRYEIKTLNLMSFQKNTQKYIPDEQRSSRDLLSQQKSSSELTGEV